MTTSRNIARMFLSLVDRSARVFLLFSRLYVMVYIMQVGSVWPRYPLRRGVHTIHGRHLHQSRDAIKTKIAMQCNQRRTRCSFRLKNTVRDYRPKLLFCQEQTSRPGLCPRLPAAKTFGDVWKLRSTEENLWL